MSISSENLKRRLDRVLEVMDPKHEFIHFGQELFYELFYHLTDVVHELDMQIPVEKKTLKNEKETAFLLKFGQKNEEINVTFSDYKDADNTELSVKIESNFKDNDFVLEHFLIIDADGKHEYYNEYEDSNLRFSTGVAEIFGQDSPFIKVEYSNPIGYAITVWLTKESVHYTDQVHDFSLLGKMNLMFEDFKTRMHTEHTLKI